MKKTLLILSLLAVFSLGLFLAGCGSKPASTTAQKEEASNRETTIKVGASAVPHAEILESIKPALQQEGINLEVVTYDDYAQLNPALNDGQIDANYFQHVPYLDSVSKEKGYKLTVAAKVHVEPIGFYSLKYKSKEELPKGAQIGIPNDPSNEYRALALLEQNGLIKLKNGIANYEASPRDITENPKDFKFVEVEAAQLPRSLPDLAAAVINTNYVLEAKLDPQTALFREDARSPYANVLVVRQGDEKRPEIQKLVRALTSPQVKKFIETKYGVAVVPAF